MRKKLLFGLLLAAAALGAAPRLADRRALLDEARLLDAELMLAKTNKSYFYIDLSASRVELRIQGVVLKTWDVAKYSQWGRPLPSGAFKLKKKEALRTPKRKNITPGAEKGAVPKTGGELELLELKDMPGHFSFEFENGITIRFKSAPRKLGARLTDIVISMGRSLFLPLKMIAAEAGKSDFTDVQVILRNEIDAKGIYWTAEEGMSVLVFRK